MIRTFIKKWIFLLVVMVFDFIIALRTSGEFFYILFWFLVSTLTLSLAWITTEYFSVKLDLKRKMCAKIEEEGILEIEAHVRNKGFLPFFNIVLRDHLSCAVAQDRQKSTLIKYLASKESLDIKYNCFCSRRGKYMVGPFELYFFDPFGLFFLKKTYHIYSQLYVYPQAFDIKRFPLLAKGSAPWFGIESSRVSGDEHEFYGTREYKQGDPIKKIHWLSTARRNRLIVKQFQKQSFYRATIMFNLDKDRDHGRGNESIAENMIKICASVSKYLIERGISLQLIAHAGEMVHISFNKGVEHLDDIFSFLAVAQAESRVKFCDILQEFYRYIPSDSSLIVIMSDEDWDCLPMMLPLEKRNVSLVPLILVSSSFVSGSSGQETLKQARSKFPQAFDLAPMFFARGDNFGEVFLRS